MTLVWILVIPGCSWKEADGKGVCGLGGRSLLLLVGEKGGIGGRNTFLAPDVPGVGTARLGVITWTSPGIGVDLAAGRNLDGEFCGVIKLAILLGGTPPLELKLPNPLVVASLLFLLLAESESSSRLWLAIVERGVMLKGVILPYNYNHWAGDSGSRHSGEDNPSRAGL